MANTDRSRKLLIRTALVTSSTIATLIGAQNLAMLDARRAEPAPALPQEPTQPLIQIIPVTALPTAVPPTAEIVHAAPSITILRRAGQTGPIQPPAIQPVAIQPPDPVQLAAPQPVIVQGEAPPPIIIQQSSGSASSGGGSSRSNSSR